MSGHSHWATITPARHGGGDPNMNLKLRYAIDKAREVSMPKDNIERAIKRGTGDAEGMTFEEITYAGFGSGGGGASMGSAGCVGYLFARKGLFSLPAAGLDEDTLMGIALDAGADDLKR